MQTHTVRGTATNIRTEDGKTVIRYHSTDVVTFDASEIVLNTGGWFTATTKTRMNQAANQFGLGYYVYQKGGIWHVQHAGKLHVFEGDSLTLKR